ncbi:MAG: aspartate aminotransferase family protein [Deltaproteobacteria bacterium]|nr:MAG: aspartate aminotransferase family protein [Deltaproteobacteria bacterium]
MTTETPTAPGNLPPRIVSPPPGPAARALIERLAAVECPAITARRDRRRAAGGDDPIVWAEATGSNVTDVDGNRYVDLAGGFAVAAIGHRHPEVVAAAHAQLDRLIHTMGDLFPAAEKVHLAETLARLAPGRLSMSILGLSGSDAVEAAIKTALIATGRSRILAFHGGYHGMSLGALGVSGYRASFRQPFASMTPRPELRLPYPDCADCPLGHQYPDCAFACLDQIARILDDPTFGGEDVAALIAEPIQGRGGDIVPPDGWLTRLRDITRERGILLILDEIYTGFGRTGRLFACQHEGVEPDLLCVGKAMGGGAPISACIGTPEVMQAWGRSTGEAIHTSTFLGHPLSAAMASAALSVIVDHDLPARAERVGQRFLEQLRKTLHGHPAVRDVRGRGLMIGIVLQDSHGRAAPGSAVLAMHRLLGQGWIISPGGRDGDVISLAPPMTIDEDLLDAFVEQLPGVLAPCP